MQRVLSVLIGVLVIAAIVASPVSAQALTGGCELEEGLPTGHCTVDGKFLDCNFPRVGGDTLQGHCRTSATTPQGEPLQGKRTITIYDCDLSLTNGAGGDPPDTNPYLDFGDVSCTPRG